ncbi:MAG: hypothetical protein AB7L09_00025 [Nitrospira sp.]
MADFGPITAGTIASPPAVGYGPTTAGGSVVPPPIGFGPTIGATSTNPPPGYSPIVAGDVRFAQRVNVVRPNRHERNRRFTFPGPIN